SLDSRAPNLTETSSRWPFSSNTPGADHALLRAARTDRQIDRVEEQHDQVDVVERAATERIEPLAQLGADRGDRRLRGLPSPASSHSDSTSRIDRPRTNPPITNALSGSVRSSRLQCHFGYSFDTNGLIGSRTCG